MHLLANSNSPKAKYKVSTNEENETKHKIQNKAIYNIGIMMMTLK
jgi:hypothetical protein